MHLQIHLNATQEQADYFEASARIRGLSRSGLVGRVMSTLLNDQLILAVLDDDSACNGRKGRYTRKVPGRANKRYLKVGYAGKDENGGL